MKAFIIIASIVVPLLLLLFSPLRFSLIYNGRLRLYISYLFLRIPLYPRKPKKKRKGKASKEKRKRAKTPHRGAAVADATSQKGEAEQKKDKPSLTFSDIRFLLRVLRELAASLIDHASKHIRLSVRRLRITIGGEDDAARAAIEYGLAAQGISYLLAALDNTGFLKKNGVRDVSLDVDYLEKGHSLDARIDVVCPFAFLALFAVRALTSALTAKGRWSKHRARSKKKS